MTEHKYSSVTGKDTIYIDIDDEITGIIDKVRGSAQRIVALVLPKRATVLQSIVNMKLLKRTADESKKQIVLITTEAGLLPLAGSVGLYVAKNLQSKPEVPLVPADKSNAESGEEDAVLMDDEPSIRPKLNPAAPIGNLAAASGAVSPTTVDDTIELDDENESKVTPNYSARSNASNGAKAKKSGPRVPNFNRFRLLLVLGGVGIVALVIVWIVCFNILPKASILVKTNASTVDTELTATLGTTTPALNEKSKAVPAQIQQVPKQYSQQVPATGQRDEGTKASGSVTMTAQECGTVTQAPDVPAGAGLSASGQTFITQQATSFTVKGIKNNCITFVASTPTPVLAQSNGTNGNIGPSTFTVAGRSDVSASSSEAMTGGTSNIVKIVSQSDIDNAKQKLGAQDTTAVKQQLQTALQNAGAFVVASSFKAEEPVTTSSANVGDKAENITVSQTVNYYMFGAKQTDLEKLVADEVKKHIDTAKQTILENGLANASFTIQSQDKTTLVTKITATSVAGSDLKVGELKKLVAGKKANEAKELIKKNPGVTDVTVAYSPFWVSSIPSNPDKLTIVIEKPSHNATRR